MKSIVFGVFGVFLGIPFAHAQETPPAPSPPAAPPPAKVIQLPVEPVSNDAQPHEMVLLQFECNPSKVRVEVDGREVCDETPCSFRVQRGEHVIEMWANYHNRRKERIAVTAGATISWKLEPRPYSYFGMNDVKTGVYPVTVGSWPTEDSYRKITAGDFVDFKKIHPIIDAGMALEVFGYETSPQGSSWSIFAFGPALRFGRFVFQLDVNLLSFRHSSDNDTTGWLPGLNFRLTIPLATERDLGPTAFLFPALAGGVDVWFDDILNHDQTRAWLGLSWLGDFDFFLGKS